MELGSVERDSVSTLSMRRERRHGLSHWPGHFCPVMALLLFLGGCGPSPQVDRVERLAESMSVEAKVGQCMVGFFRGTSLSAEQTERMRRLRLGGVILYTSSGNIDSTAQVATLTGSIQDLARREGQVPLFVSIDQEGGLVSRLTKGVTVFPGNMALGAGGSEALSARSAAITAHELRALGITMNFAPVVDVNSNPANPVIGIRSFGSDPMAVARLGAATLGATHAEGVLCAAKHFPGHGDTDVDSHLGLPVVNHDRPTLEALEFPPFRAMARAGVPMVMTAHVKVPALDPSGLPATLSAPILGLLRYDMGYRGLIVTDSMGMGAIVQNWGREEASILSFLAGADLLLYGADVGSEPADQEAVHAALVAAVHSGRIPLQRLDESVRRILEAKERYGILDDPYPVKAWQESLGSPEHLAVAREIAQQGATLVRNNRKLLPLSGMVPTPVIWPREVESYLQPLLAELPWLSPTLVPLQATAEDITRVVDQVRGAPVVLVGSYNLDKNARWKEVIRALQDQNIVVVAVRSPYDLMQVPGLHTYLALYSDRPAALQGLASLLTGRTPPRGHLPVELPGLHPLGWGLTAF